MLKWLTGLWDLWSDWHFNLVYKLHAYHPPVRTEVELNGYQTHCTWMVRHKQVDIWRVTAIAGPGLVEMHHTVVLHNYWFLRPFGPLRLRWAWHRVKRQIMVQEETWLGLDGAYK